MSEEAAAGEEAAAVEGAAAGAGAPAAAAAAAEPAAMAATAQEAGVDGTAAHDDSNVEMSSTAELACPAAATGDAAAVVEEVVEAAVDAILGQVLDCVEAAAAASGSATLLGSDIPALTAEETAQPDAPDEAVAPAEEPVAPPAGPDEQAAAGEPLGSGQQSVSAAEDSSPVAAVAADGGEVLAAEDSEATTPAEPQATAAAAEEEAGMQAQASGVVAMQPPEEEPPSGCGNAEQRADMRRGVGQDLLPSSAHPPVETLPLPGAEAAAEEENGACGQSAEETEEQVAGSPTAVAVEQPAADADSQEADAGRMLLSVLPMELGGAPAAEQEGQGTDDIEGGAGSAAAATDPAGAASEPGTAGGALPLPGEASYGEVLQREVSAKLLLVLSEQKLGRHEAEGEGDTAAAGAVLQPAASQLPTASAGQPAPAGEAPLLRWVPAARPGGPHRQQAPFSGSPRERQGQHSSVRPGPHSPPQQRRMAPLPSGHSPTSGAGERVSPGVRRGVSAGARMPPLSQAVPSGALALRRSALEFVRAAAPASLPCPLRPLAGMAAGGSPESPTRRLAKPSVSAILGTAGRPARQSPPRARGGSAGTAPAQLLRYGPHQGPLLLPGTGLSPAPFQPMGGAPPAAPLLHWGPRFVPPLATGAGIPPGAGWYAPLGAVPGQPAPAGAMPPPADLAKPSPAAAPQPQIDSKGMGGTADSPATVPAADGSPDDPAALGGEAAHPYYAPGVAMTPQPGRTVDVAASWPPHRGAKLPLLVEVRWHVAQVQGVLPCEAHAPPLTLDCRRCDAQEERMSGPGLIPAVHHSAANFSVMAPARGGHQPAWAAPPPGAPAWPMHHAPPAGYFMPPPLGAGPWAGPPGMVAPLQWDAAAGMPAAGAGAGGAPDQQQLAAYRQYQQQVLAYQAQAQLAAQQAAWQAAAAHDDEPLYVREPMPQVPVALDPSGRPFKV